MEELELFLRGSDPDNISTILFYTKNYVWTGFSVLVKKDFKIESIDVSYHGYFFELENEKNLNLKQFKIEFIQEGKIKNETQEHI